jgi:membrane associated rhomboid family serine protease
MWGRGPGMLWFEAWPVLVMTGLLWLVFGGQLIGEALGYDNAIFALGALSKMGFDYGLWWTPLSHMFLHAGWLHIAMNSAALIALGPAVAQRFGRDALGGLLFLAFFVACGLAGGATFLLLAPANVPAVGASGAIFGLWGAVARLAAPGQIKLAPLFSRGVGQQVGSAIVSNLLVIALGAGYGLASNQGIIGIAWQAHLGGFIAGILLIQLMPVRFHWLRGQPKGSLPV